MKNKTLFSSKIRSCAWLTAVCCCLLTLAQAQKVGINTATPEATLDVNGTTKTDSFQMATGATDGYFLQCDADGNGYWQSSDSIRYNVLQRNSAHPDSTYIAADFYSTPLTISGAKGNFQWNTFLSIHFHANVLNNSSFYWFYLISPSGKLLKFSGYGVNHNADFRSDRTVFAFLSSEDGTGTTGEYGLFDPVTNDPGIESLIGEPINGEWKIWGDWLATNYQGGMVLHDWSITVIEDLNPFADDLGNHTATENLQIGGNYINNDGDNEGLTIDVNGDAAFSGRISTTTFQMTNGAFNGAFLQSDASGNANWASTDQFSIGYWMLNGSDMHSTPTGKVGIGTTTPADKLHVVGNARIDAGRLFFANNGESVFVGENAGANDDFSANQNVFVGFDAGAYNNAGTSNIGIGYRALYTNLLGTNNTALGYYAGRECKGSGNVFLGNYAGYAETGSHKLYIDNSNTSSPLIWGDFSNDYLNFNANVGIGTTTPTQAKLVVNGALTNTFSYAYLNSNANIGTCANCTGTYSIYANSRIAASEFNAFSDRRIKKNLRRSDAAADLAKLMQLQITDYQMVDSIAKGNKVYKKVIAQEVAEVLPSAVSTMTDVLPDIYQLAEIKAGFVSIKDSGVRPGELVRLIFGEKEALAEVLQANENGFLTQLTEEGPVFVYGRQVSDFHTVDYEALTTLNISATQALVKKVMELQQQSDKLQMDNASMKADIKALKSAVFGNASINK